MRDYKLENFEDCLKRIDELAKGAIGMRKKGNTITIVYPKESKQLEVSNSEQGKAVAELLMDKIFGSMSKECKDTNTGFMPDSSDINTSDIERIIGILEGTFKGSDAETEILKDRAAIGEMDIEVLKQNLAILKSKKTHS